MDRATRALCFGALATWGGLLGPAALAGELVIATVNNGHMITMQRLSTDFERRHPGTRLKWVTMEEGALRQQIAADIATRKGRFDVMTIGVLEAPIWGSRGWLKPIEDDPAYDMADLLPAIRQSLSYKDQLYASPFYGESDMTLYRTDLFKAAGLSMPAQPTWAQIQALATRLHKPEQGVHGLCLRAKPGWGENMTLLTPMVNSLGGQWFNMDWRPQLDTRPWLDAVKLYTALVSKLGPPASVANGYNENLALFNEGHCAIWVDATVAGAFVNRPGVSRVAGKVGFAQAPYASVPKGAHWLWAWALAVPVSSRQPAEAMAFVKWATSREYIRLVAAREGWAAVPSGTRLSTYASPEFMKANAYAEVERQAITSADPHDSTVPRSPYTGVQLAVIPEFQAIGTAVGEEIAAILTDGQSIDAALARAQAAAERKMREAGYLK